MNDCYHVYHLDYIHKCMHIYVLIMEMSHLTRIALSLDEE